MSSHSRSRVRADAYLRFGADARRSETTWLFILNWNMKFVIYLNRLFLVTGDRFSTLLKPDLWFCFALSFTEPSECLAVLCDMECPSDSKSVKIDLDSVSFVTNSSILHSKRKRAIIDRHREQLVRHLREVNETQKCCECKCDFAKCPEFMCPDHQYKSTVLAGTRIPGSCCPKFQCMTERPTCFSLNLQRHFNPLDKWKDDSCTQCECSETGEMNCESPACKPLSCEKKQVVEGECCPVCDINDSKFCEPECDLHCRNGFEHDPVRNCATCKCVKSTPITKVTTTVAMGPGILPLWLI